MTVSALPLVEGKIQVEEYPEGSRKNFSVDVRNAQIILEGLEACAKKQEAYGLGAPTDSLKWHQEQYKSMVYMAQADALAEKFKQIHEPSNHWFPRFNSTESTRLPELPKLAMARLDKGVRSINLTVGNSSYRAFLPIMPETVIDLGQRAKELAPNAELHLLFLPQWHPAPNPDPVLIAYVPVVHQYFRIASWDSDAALIEEFLEDAK